MYKWTEEAEREGGSNAEMIPHGFEGEVTITKLVFGKGQGDAYEPFTSKAGDPQMLIIVADDQEREAAQMVTLSDKAGWVLAKFLQGIGANLQKLEEQGIGPEKFADEPDWAQKVLVGRALQVSVKHEKSGDKTYARVTPLMPQAPANAPARPAPQRQAPAPRREPVASVDDIPF